MWKNLLEWQTDVCFEYSEVAYWFVKYDKKHNFIFINRISEIFDQIIFFTDF